MKVYVFNFSYSIEFYCECPIGFDGMKCEINVNDCNGINCPNNKICFDLVDDYECRCPQGYTGENCSQEINECVSSPCQNGATCIDQPVRNGKFLMVT